MSDLEVKVVYKELEQQLLHVEVKGPGVVSEDNEYHPDFIKIANLLKDELDLMLDTNCPYEAPIYGILVGGCKATIYAMDLVYTKIYRLHNVTTFNIPHGRHDLTRL